MTFILKFIKSFIIGAIMKNIARIIFLTLFAFMLIGCRTIKYVPQEIVKLDSIYISKVRVDSIKETDSVYIVNGKDTVFVNRYKLIDRWHKSIDTLWYVKNDTIRKYVKVEAQLTKWQKFKINMGEYFILIIIAGFVTFLIYLRIKR